MRIIEAGPRNQQALSQGQSAWLRVMVAYEDFTTGTRIKQAFDSILSRIGDRTDFQFDLWRFDLLRDPDLNARAAKEAEAADVVVVSSHGGVDPPAEIKSWLRRWLEKRDDKPGALVVSVDSPTWGADNRLLEDLRTLAETAGVDLIQHPGGPPAGSDLTGGCGGKRDVRCEFHRIAETASVRPPANPEFPILLRRRQPRPGFPSSRGIERTTLCR